MKLSAWFLAVVIVAPWAGPARAHETDQFTVPPGRKFADLGGFFNRWAFRAIQRGVDVTNAQIRAALAVRKPPGVLAELQSPPHVTMAVRNQWPWSVTQIERFEAVLRSQAMRARYPGRVVSYGERFAGVYQPAFFPLDFRQLAHLLFFSSTIKVCGVYMGTDKFGHFTDEGISYYFAYHKARDAGAGEKDAIAQAVRIGTDGIMSERGILGLAANADYSNGDLSGNFAGFLFYRNLTETVRIKGRLIGPMLVRDGPYWRTAADVTPDSGFFARFISDRLDEALNPGYFAPYMRQGLRDGIRRQTRTLLAHYCDEHGQPRPREWFDRKFREVCTYWGIDYGHLGTYDELATIGNSCFDSVRAPVPRPPLDGNARLAASIVRGSRLADPIENDRPHRLTRNTALDLAIREDRGLLVQTLLRQGADPNSRVRGESPLHLACGDSRLAAELIRSGARVNAPDARGQTPLHWAAQETGRATSLPVLLAHGGSCNVRDHDGRTPLHLAAQSGNGQAVAELLEDGASVLMADDLGQTALHLAAESHTDAAVGELLAAGAAVNVRDVFGRTPLHEAARSGSVGAVRRLLAAGADVWAADDYGTTPLHLACRRGRIEIVRLLLDAGAPINASSAAGVTPLHEVANSGDAALVRLLLDRGAMRAMRDGRGRTAADVAASRGFGDLVPLLHAGASWVSGGPR